MLPFSFHHSFVPLSIALSSFATNLVINHDDSIDTDVHAIAMRTVVDGRFVHDAEPQLEFVVRLLGCANIGHIRSAHINHNTR